MGFEGKLPSLEALELGGHLDLPTTVPIAPPITFNSLIKLVRPSSRSTFLLARLVL